MANPIQNRSRYDADVRARRLAVVVREVATAERFETLADLVEAVKTRAARLRLPWTRDAIDHAIAMVESNRPIVVRARTARPRVPAANVRPSFAAFPSREAAAAWIAELKGRVDFAIRVMR